MADIHRVNRPLTIRKYQRDKIVQQSSILAIEVRALEIEDEINRCRRDIDEMKIKMSDLEAKGHEQQNSQTDPHQKQIVAKKCLREKLLLLSQAEAREIRAMELADEVTRCAEEIKIHQAEMDRLDMNIRQQEELIVQEKAEVVA
jgi:hypothetical protein